MVTKDSKEKPENFDLYNERFRQIPGIGTATAENLAMMGYTTISELANETAEGIIRKYESIGETISGRNAGKIVGYAQRYIEKREKWSEEKADILGISVETAEQIFDSCDYLKDMLDVSNKKLKEDYGIQRPKEFKDKISFLIDEDEDDEESKIPGILDDAEDEEIAGIDYLYREHYQPAVRKSIARLMDLNSLFVAGDVVDLKTVAQYVEEITEPLIRFYSTLYSGQVIDFKRNQMRLYADNARDGSFLFQKSDAIANIEGELMDVEDWPDSVLDFIETYNACKDLGCTEYFPVDLAVLVDVASDEPEIETIISSIKDIVLAIADEDLPHDLTQVAGIDKIFEYEELYQVKTAADLNKLMDLRNKITYAGISNEDAIDFAKKIYQFGIHTVEDLMETNPKVLKSIKGLNLNEKVLDKVFEKIEKIKQQD